MAYAVVGQTLSTADRLYPSPPLSGHLTGVGRPMGCGVGKPPTRARVGKMVGRKGPIRRRTPPWGTGWCGWWWLMSHLGIPAGGNFWGVPSHYLGSRGPARSLLPDTGGPSQDSGVEPLSRAGGIWLTPMACSCCSSGLSWLSGHAA